MNFLQNPLHAEFDRCSENGAKIYPKNMQLKITSHKITSNPSEGRFPEIDCCPTQAIIWEMLINDPFEPEIAIISGAFLLKKFAYF